MQRWKVNLAVLWFGNFLVMAGMTIRDTWKIGEIWPRKEAVEDAAMRR